MTRSLIVAVLAFLVFAGCGVTTPEYTAPQSSASMDNTTVTLDQPYDLAWDKLINFTSSRFFAIDNYEKDSGLMTLSFSSDPGRFINCGTIKTDGPPAYEGDYVEWFDERPGNLDLDGRMNLTVQEVGENKTRAEVNVRYVVTAANSSGQTVQWAFNTGGSDTQKVPANAFGATQTRTCQPTHEAEKVIIEGIQDS